jgi:hypothetical protein
VLTERNDHYRLLFDYEHEHRFTEHEHGAAKTDTNQYQPLHSPMSPLKHRFHHLYDLFKSVKIASSNL